MKHVVIPTVNALIIRNSKILLSRRANTGWMDGRLCVPGGHIETGEAPRIALIREIEEELGVTVKLEDIEFASVVARTTTEGETAAYEFIIRNKDYAFRNAEPEKCSELVWADIHNLPDDTIDHFRQIITQSIIDKKTYLEIGY